MPDLGRTEDGGARARRGGAVPRTHRARWRLSNDALISRGGTRLPLTTHWIGFTALAVFAAAYAAVAAEERLRLGKSVPVLAAAGLVWILVGLGLAGDGERLAELARHNLLEFAELFLFLVVAMTYVNTLEERGVFDAVRAGMVGR